MPPTQPDPRHAQLRTWYEQLTARIEALDRDIGWALTLHDRTIHKERRDVLVADRELVTAYQIALERGEPPPGHWPPEFKTIDLVVAPSRRILFKSGRCDFYRHIPLPPNYIPRPELLAEVRERLLAGTGGLALTSAIQVRRADVLHGMGGIGKSVLARALCDDPDVQAAFPDGILWATLGQTPDLTARLREWIETLGGIVGQTAPTLDQLRNTLAEALRDKACLLILDDAWRKAHLEPFCAGGPACRLLITTRDAALAEGLDAGVYPVPVMAPDQAVALLGEWAQGGLAKVEAEVKAKVVRRLGCLPLAVRLAAAQLRQKDAAEWLASFDARRLKTRRVETVHDSLAATFALSLDALAPTDRRLYVVLAIFKEDEATPVAAISRLWFALDDRDADETGELLEDLAARALLGRSRVDGDTVTIHDLLRDFMVAELSEYGRIAAHRGLLDAYRKTQQEDGWHTAPDDGYLYSHLAYHLDQLTHHDTAAETELEGLFADQSWLHARVSQSGYRYDSYLDDLEVAWRAAPHEDNADQEPSALADYARYALIRTSVNSLAANYVPALIVQAVRVGLWQAERTLSILQQVPEPGERSAMAVTLLEGDVLPKDVRERVLTIGLAAAQGIRSEGHRAEALAALAPQLTGEARAEVLQAALAAAQGIRSEWHQAEALAALAPQLTGAARAEVLQAALAAAQGIANEISRASALASLAPQLTDDLLEAGLAAAQGIAYERARAEVLATLAPQLTGDLLEAGLAAAQGIRDQEFQTRALAALAPQLTGEARAEVLQAALAAAQGIRSEWHRAEALTALAPQLTGEARAEVLQAALAAAQGIADEGDRAEALAALTPQLTGAARAEVLQAALAAAQGIRSEWHRAKALAALAPQLTGDLLEAGLVAAQGIAYEWHRAEALAALAPQLTDDLREAGLVAAQGIAYEWHRAEALAALAPQLTGEARAEVLQAALAAAQGIADEGDRAKALAAFLPLSSDPTPLLRDIRRTMADHLWKNLANRKRTDVLKFIADEKLFAPPILSPDTLTAIARHIIEICTEWEWL